MDSKDFVGVVLVVFLSLWGMLYLESDLQDYFMEELLIILVLVIAASGMLYGLATSKDWAWSSLTGFFAFAAINTVVVYLATGNSTPFLLTLFVNIAGFAVCGAKAVNLELPYDSGMPSPADDIPDLPPMPLKHISESDLIDHIDIEENIPEDRIYHVDEADLIDHVDFEPIVELNTYNDSPVYKKNPKTFKKTAGKKKKSAKKKKR